MKNHNHIIERIAVSILTSSNEELALMQTMSVLEKVHLSRNYGSELWKKSTQYSIHDFIEQEKIYRIRKQISDARGYTIENACDEFGIRKEDHLIKKFKRRYVLTPGKYKKLYYQKCM